MSTPDPSSTPFRPEIARRVTPLTGGLSHSGTADSKQLIVGRDISLTGEINTCEKLIVEGQVQATLSACHSIDVAKTGTFTGTAEVEDCEVSGLFDGELIVHGRLLVHASGKVTGRIRYGELEVERGGELDGDVLRTGADAPVLPASRADTLERA